MCTYEVVGERLRLDQFYMGLDAGTEDPAGVPDVGGVAGVFDPDVHVWRYEGLALPVEFSGGLLVCDGFIQDLYVHMGYHPAWKYTKVLELYFDDGRLTAAIDRSADAARVREAVASGERSDPDAGYDTSGWIERTFTLDYSRSLPE